MERLSNSFNNSLASLNWTESLEIQEDSSKLTYSLIKFPDLSVWHQKDKRVVNVNLKSLWVEPSILQSQPYTHSLFTKYKRLFGKLKRDENSQTSNYILAPLSLEEIQLSILLFGECEFYEKVANSNQSEDLWNSVGASKG